MSGKSQQIKINARKADAVERMIEGFKREFNLTISLLSGHEKISFARKQKILEEIKDNLEVTIQNLKAARSVFPISGAQ